MTMVVFLKKELRDMFDWYLAIGVMPEEIAEAVNEQLSLLDPTSPEPRPSGGGSNATRQS